MLNLELLYDPSMPLLGIHLKRNKNVSPHKNMDPNVHSGIIHMSQKEEKTQMPITEKGEIKCVISIQRNGI